MPQSKSMSSHQTALENLRVIRSLMEKAHIYRAVSGQAAVFGGLLSLVQAGRQLNAGFHDPAAGSAEEFLAGWLGLLLAVSVFNAVMLFREARRRGQAFLSQGMRMALRALVPPLMVGGAVGIGLILSRDSLTPSAIAWILGYGLALLATASFSPSSLVRLGWAFVVAGLMLFWVWASNGEVRLLPGDLAPASACMGMTFGLFHLVYGAAVMIGGKPEPLAAE
jgi:hypothetical protein